MNQQITELEFRMTKRLQMSKNEGIKQQCGRFSWFRLGHSIDIRRRLLVVSRFLLIAALALILDDCVGRRLRKANVDEVSEGMSKKQVESILGPPTNIDNKDFILLKRTIYVYRQNNDLVTIVFKDDKVSEKQSTLTD